MSKEKHDGSSSLEGLQGDAGNETVMVSVCPNCGIPVQSDGRCPRCGKTTQAEMDEVFEARRVEKSPSGRSLGRECPQCGVPIQFPSAQYCRGCGAQLHPNADVGQLAPSANPKLPVRVSLRPVGSQEGLIRLVPVSIFQDEEVSVGSHVWQLMKPENVPNNRAGEPAGQHRVPVFWVKADGDLRIMLRDDVLLCLRHPWPLPDETHVWFGDVAFVYHYGIEWRSMLQGAPNHDVPDYHPDADARAASGAEPSATMEDERANATVTSLDPIPPQTIVKGVSLEGGSEAGGTVRKRYFIDCLVCQHPNFRGRVINFTQAEEVITVEELASILGTRVSTLKRAGVSSKPVRFFSAGGTRFVDPGEAPNMFVGKSELLVNPAFSNYEILWSGRRFRIVVEFE